MKEQKKSKGLLITFEGGEGSGKTLQIKLLEKELRRCKKEVVIAREPGGTVIAEQIRQVVLSPENIGMDLTAEVLLFQAARAQIYRELILPSINAGKIVVCDRSRDSSTVYQGIVRGFGEKRIKALNNLATQKTYPDITFLLDVPVKIGLSRRRKTGENDRLDMEQTVFHEQVRKAYLRLAKRNDHYRWIIIDGTKAIKRVHQDIIFQLRKKKVIR